MYIVAILKVHVKIGGIVVNGILNSSIEVNIIIKALIDKARLIV